MTKKTVNANRENSAPLLSDIRQLIETSQKLTVTLNSSLTLLYWQLGQRIHTEILGGARAAFSLINRR